MPPQQVEDQSRHCSLHWCYRTMKELTSMSDVLYFEVLFISSFLEGYSIGFNVYKRQHALLFCLYSVIEVYNERDWRISPYQTLGIPRVLRIAL
jgi:hypothetical protein